MSITGRCLCGQVSYESSSSEPLLTAVCHCRNCQRQGGSAFSIIVGVPANGMTVNGTLKTFDDHGDSGGIVHRQFCPDCGSPIFSVIDSMPDLTIIKAGTLDDVSMLKPQMQVWCKSAQPWVALDPALPAHATDPSAA